MLRQKSKEKISMENFEIVKDFYNWESNPRREADNGVSPDDLSLIHI